MSTALDDLTVNNLGTLRTINKVCLPATYSDDWYKQNLEASHIARLAFFAELPVGGITAKAWNNSTDLTTFESSNASSIGALVPNIVYIQSLAVLPAYRNLGIGKKLLEFVVEETKKRFIHEIALHVQENNKHAVQWYEKHGFVVQSTVKDYYKEQGLEDPGALLLTLKI